MFYGADRLLFARAKELRSKPTHAENVFWQLLKEHFPSYKFRRQHPISIYIADFYCHKLKLVIEIDGSVHSLSEVRHNDEKRQFDLESLGICIIRFTNDQVKTQVEAVINQTAKTIIILETNRKTLI